MFLHLSKNKLNTDTLKGTIANSEILNRYAYANGNPVSLVDPFGTSAEPGNDKWHTFLDIAGMLPGIGMIFDAANGIWYASEGKWSSAALSAAAFIPYIGDIGEAGKLGYKASKFLKDADEAEDIAKVAEEVAETGGQGYKSFNALKNAIGSAGEDNQWHHIVEQCQINKSGFTSMQINNTDNIIAIDKTIHTQISGYYNTTTFDFTNGLSVRNWLAGQSFESQYDFGINVLNRFGVTK